MIILLVGFFFAQFAVSYVPAPSMILERVTDKLGQSEYRIRQDVKFRGQAGEVLLVKETWTVFNSKDYSLVAESFIGETKVARFEIDYRDGKKTFLASGQDKEAVQKRSVDLPSDFYWSILLARNSRKLLNLLNERGFIDKDLPLPSEIEKAERQKALEKARREQADQATGANSASGPPEETPQANEPEFVYESPLWLRLARKSGRVSYQFALGPAKPSVWVVQDEFDIHALRMASGAKILRNSFERYTGNFHWPSKTTVQWDEHVTEIELLNIEKIKAKKDSVAVAKPFLDSDLEPYLRQQVERFYQRFR